MVSLTIFFVKDDLRPSSAEFADPSMREKTQAVFKEWIAETEQYRRQAQKDGLHQRERRSTRGSGNSS
jgi:hypothetical protein